MPDLETRRKITRLFDDRAEDTSSAADRKLTAAWLAYNETHKYVTYEKFLEIVRDRRDEEKPGTRQLEW